MSNDKSIPSTIYCLSLSNAAESKALLPGLVDKSKEYSLTLNFIKSIEELTSESKVNGIMAFGEYDSNAVEKLENIRQQFPEQSIPIFVLTPHQLIKKDMQALADKTHVQIISLPISIDQLCIDISNACLEAIKGSYNSEPNLRRYSRVAVSHQAYTVVEVELVDVSIGGICFKSNTYYKTGQTDRIQFSATDLIDSVDFEVTKVDTVEDEKYKYSVSARFYELQKDVLSNVSDSLIEPEPFL